MPSSKKRPQEDHVALTSRQFASSMELLLPSLKITDGAMEALRLAHSEFLDLMASELASNKEHLEKLIQPKDIKACLERLGLDGTIVPVDEVENPKKPAKKKRKKFAVSQEMVAEQERLLEQSRLSVQAQHKENDKKRQSK